MEKTDELLLHLLKEKGIFFTWKKGKHPAYINEVEPSPSESATLLEEKFKYLTEDKPHWLLTGSVRSVEVKEEKTKRQLSLEVALFKDRSLLLQDSSRAGLEKLGYKYVRLGDNEGYWIKTWEAEGVENNLTEEITAVSKHLPPAWEAIKEEKCM